MLAAGLEVNELLTNLDGDIAAVEPCFLASSTELVTVEARRYGEETAARRTAPRVVPDLAGAPPR